MIIDPKMKSITAEDLKFCLDNNDQIEVIEEIINFAIKNSLHIDIRYALVSATVNSNSPIIKILKPYGEKFPYVDPPISRGSGSSSPSFCMCNGCGGPV